MNIIHIITSLDDGGAEAVLYRLISHEKNHSHIVVSLATEGKYGPLLRSKGITVIALGLNPSTPSPWAFLKLVQFIRSEMPCIVQTWMYHADLFGGLAAKLSGVKSIVWGIHHTVLERGKSKRRTIWIAKLLARLSWWLPSRIAACAQRAIDVHAELGYCREKMVFIPNGFNLDDFFPQPLDAQKLRIEWCVDPNFTLIGTVGRDDPQKDHSNLLEALSILRSRNIAAICVMVGTNLDRNNESLMTKIHHFGLQDSVILLGRRTDIPAVMSALDVHILSSSAEAFPNVVAEAMACQTPCVVTDVGDAANIVGPTGWVVPSKNSILLANAIEQSIKESQINDEAWLNRKYACRDRIIDNFDLKRMLNGYDEIWGAS